MAETMEEWNTLAELAEEQKCSPLTIKQAIDSGELEAYRIGRRLYRVRREAWERFLASRRVVPRGA